MVLLLNKIEVILHTFIFALNLHSTCLLKIYHSGIEIVVLLYVNSGSRKKQSLSKSIVYFITGFEELEKFCLQFTWLNSCGSMRY